MKRLACLAAALVVAGCAAGTQGASGTQELAGRYSVTGETVTGDRYLGSIRLTPGGQGFDVTWDRVDPLPTRGVALRLDNVLGVAAETVDQDFGVVLYRVKGGHLEGIWQGHGARRGSALGHENLDGDKGLEGIFAISLGQNPDGSSYSGKVSIHKAGRMYSVNWYTPELRYIGTGVMVGDIFVVGYSADHRSAVAAYCLRDAAAAEGITAEITDGGLGSEQFWPTGITAPSTGPLSTLRDRDGTFDCGKPAAQGGAVSGT